MSAIFISHSSKDRVIAGEVKARLTEEGHRSLFLDFDPADGIPAGRNWERELYAQLRACQAVIVLCSEHLLASHWCFAEITHARALGKHLFPLRIDDVAIPSLFTDLQIIDFTADRPEGYRRLSAGLRHAGMDPVDMFDWDERRPPYPGLLAFHEQDAGIYFGRDTAIHAAVETLNRLRQFGGARLALVLGASGAGKSSLIRAGVVPRLRRARDSWLVLDPFRPLTHPVEELALVLSAAFDRHGSAHDWKSIRDRLDTDEEAGGSRHLIELANDLRSAAKQREAAVLLVIDQIEELLGPAADASANRFLRIVRGVVDDASSPMLVVGTLRSDFLDAFQSHDAIRDLRYEPILLSQMAVADYAHVIDGPARVAALELETGLTDAIVRDTAADDALPLLAFTLRELWERYGRDRRLMLEDYRDRLGGLKGAVARRAEEVCRDLTPAQEHHLRRVFMSLVRVGSDGHFTRKPARWAALPDDAHPLLERFVQARLLVSRTEAAEPVLEVAHESIFRSWDRLVAWLNADREFLLWRQRLQDEMAEWVRTERHETTLLRGPLLGEAERWLQDRPEDLLDGERDFIQAGIALRVREEQAQQARHQRELEAAQRLAAETEKRRQIESASAARLRRRLILVVALLVAAAASGVIAYLNARQASRTLATADFTQAYELVQRERVDQALAYLARAVRTFPGDRAAADRIFSLLVDRRHLLPATAPIALPGQVVAIHSGADGRSLVAVIKGSTAQVLDARSGTPLTPKFEHDGKVVGAAQFSPNGKLLATGCGASNAQLNSGLWPHRSYPAPDNDTSGSASGPCYGRLWDIASGQPATPPLRHAGAVLEVQFNADGTRLATASDDHTARVWDVATGQAVTEPLPNDDVVTSVRFSPDGAHVAMAAHDVSVWDVAAPKGAAWRAKPPEDHEFFAVAYSPDGRRVVAVAEVHDDDESSQAVTLFDASTGKEIGPGSAAGPLVTAVVFNPLSRDLMVSYAGRYRNKDSIGGVFEISSDTGRVGADEQRVSNPVASLAIAPGGTEVFIASFDQSVVWNDRTAVNESPVIGRLTLPDVPAHIAVSPSGTELLAVSGAGADTVQLWSLAIGTQLPRLHALAKPPELRPSLGETSEPAVVATSADGTRAVKLETEKSFIVVDAKTAAPVGAALSSVGGYEGRLLTARFSTNGKLIATGEGGDFRIQTGFARVWDAATGRPLTAPLAHRLAVGFVEFIERDTRLVTVANRRIDGPGFVQLWDVRTGRPVTDALRTHITPAAATFDRERAQLTALSEEGLAEVRDVAFPAQGSLPDWLPTLAEAVGGFQLNETSGVLEPIPDRRQKLDVLHRELSAKTTRDPFTRAAAWFFGKRETRTMSPFSDLTVSEYVAQCIADGNDALLDHAESLAAGHSDWLARIQAKRAQ